jgi:hypothetical protein
LTAISCVRQVADAVAEVVAVEVGAPAVSSCRSDRLIPLASLLISQLRPRLQLMLARPPARLRLPMLPPRPGLPSQTLPRPTLPPAAEQPKATLAEERPVAAEPTPAEMVRLAAAPLEAAMRTRSSRSVSPVPIWGS